jgi:hypothetical protein
MLGVICDSIKRSMTTVKKVIHEKKAKDVDHQLPSTQVIYKASQRTDKKLDITREQCLSDTRVCTHSKINRTFTIYSIRCDL